MGELSDWSVCVVHSESNSSSIFEAVYLGGLYRASISWGENYIEFSGAFYNEIGSFVLICVGVSSNDYRFLPSLNHQRNVFADDWFSEDGSS